MSTGIARSTGTEPQYEQILEQYAAAMKWFGQQKFDRAKPLLEKICLSRYSELADRARMHLSACNGRLADGKNAAHPPEECYQHAVVRMNAGHYDEAAELLKKAIAGGSRPHYSYALACLRALTGDADGALSALKESIASDPRGRLLARNDGDFRALADDPRFTEILYPERG